jgi:hypothetical protein
MGKVSVPSTLGLPKSQEIRRGGRYLCHTDQTSEDILQVVLPDFDSPSMEDILRISAIITNELETRRADLYRKHRYIPDPLKPTLEWFWLELDLRF